MSRGLQDLEQTGAARAGEVLRRLVRDLDLRADDLTGRLHATVDRRLTGARHALAILRERMTPGRLAERLRGRRAAFEGFGRLLHASVAARLQRARGAQAAYAERLQALSPLAVLGRGYAICRAVDGGAILKDSAAVRTGDAVRVTLHRGSLGCAVTEVRSDDKPEEGV